MLENWSLLGVQTHLNFFFFSDTPKFFTFRNVTRNLAGFIRFGDVLIIEQVAGDSGLVQRIIKLKTLH